MWEFITVFGRNRTPWAVLFFPRNFLPPVRLFFSKLTRALFTFTGTFWVFLSRYFFRFSVTFLVKIVFRALSSILRSFFAFLSRAFYLVSREFFCNLSRKKKVTKRCEGEQNKHCPLGGPDPAQLFQLYWFDKSSHFPSLGNFLIKVNTYLHEAALVHLNNLYLRRSVSFGNNCIWIYSWNCFKFLSNLD